MDNATQGRTPRNITIINLTWVTYFFLLRQDVNCKDSIDTTQQPFRLKDVQFFIGQQPYNAATSSNAVLTQADFVSLLVTAQNRSKQLDTAALATLKGVQWRPCIFEIRRSSDLRRSVVRRRSMPLPARRERALMSSLANPIDEPNYWTTALMVVVMSFPRICCHLLLFL